MIKEMVGLKCPNHDKVRDNHHFMYRSKTSFKHTLHKVWIYYVSS